MDPASFLWHLWYWICSFRWFWLLLVRSRSITRFVHLSSLAFNIFSSVLTQVFNHGWKPCKFSPTLKKATFAQKVHFRFPDLHCPFLFRWVPVQIWFVTFCSHTTAIKKLLGLCWAVLKSVPKLLLKCMRLYSSHCWVPDPFKILIVWCEIHLNTPELPGIPLCFK